MKRYVIGNHANTKFVAKGDYGDYIWVDDPTYADRRNSLEEAVKMYKERKEWGVNRPDEPVLGIYELATVVVDYDEWADVWDELDRVDALFEKLTENEKKFLKEKLKA